MAVRAPEPAFGAAEVVAAVDDRPDVPKYIVSVLSGTKMDLRSSKDPATASVELRETPPDLLVTDVSMPGISGLELARRLSEHVQSSKVFLVSGYSGDEELERLRLRAPKSTLAKPFSSARLLQQVTKVLEGSRSWRDVLDQVREGGSGLA